MLLMSIGFVLVAAFVGLGIWAVRRENEGYSILGWVVGILLGITMIVTSAAVPIGNASRLQGMAAFHDANVDNYAMAMRETESILSSEKYIVQALVPVEGSIEKWRLADSVAQRMLEWRDAVNRYNVALYEFRYWDRSIWLGAYYPTPPDRLKLLRIEAGENG